ncbi:MAG: lipoprotein [Xanthobacteraceae bacterium]
MSNCPRPAFVRFVLFGALAAALALAGCGRKGPLDPPPSAAVAQPAPAAAQVSGMGANSAAPPAQSGPKSFDADGRPIAPPGAKKPLLLDWLID